MPFYFYSNNNFQILLFNSMNFSIIFEISMSCPVANKILTPMWNTVAFTIFCDNNFIIRFFVYVSFSDIYN